MATVNLAVLGPCQVWYKGSELGKTFGGVRVAITETIADVRYDQVGLWNRIQVGKTIVVTAAFANLSHTLIDALLGNEAFLLTGGTTPTCDQVLAIYLGLGISHRDSGGELILKPFVGGAMSTDPCQWFHVPLTYPELDAELVYDETTQRVLLCRFQALPVSQNNPLMAYFGCPALLPAALPAIP